MRAVLTVWVTQAAVKQPLPNVAGRRGVLGQAEARVARRVMSMRLAVRVAAVPIALALLAPGEGPRQVPRIQWQVQLQAEVAERRRPGQSSREAVGPYEARPVTNVFDDVASAAPLVADQRPTPHPAGPRAHDGAQQ